MINRNMRCIEITITLDYPATILKINRNMRCIEILLCGFVKIKIDRLIET